MSLRDIIYSKKKSNSSLTRLRAIIKVTRSLNNVLNHALTIIWSSKCWSLLKIKMNIRKCQYENSLTIHSQPCWMMLFSNWLKSKIRARAPTLWPCKALWDMSLNIFKITYQKPNRMLNQTMMLKKQMRLTDEKI